MDEASTTDTDYLHQQQAAIEVWRERPPSVTGRVLGTVASPVAWVIRKAVPASAIEGVLRGADWVAQKTTGGGATAGLPVLDLRDADTAADRFQTQSVALAVVEGAGTGATGLPGLIVDIPAVITLALRTIRGVGAAYGYTGGDEAERQFALGVLAAAGANTPAEKQAALALLVQLNVLIAKTTFKTMAAVAAAQPLSQEAAVLMMRQLAKQLGVNLTKRKLAQAIPIVGGVVGAAASGTFISDVGWAARRSYQARWIEDHARDLAANG